MNPMTKPESSHGSTMSLPPASSYHELNNRGVNLMLSGDNHGAVQTLGAAVALIRSRAAGSVAASSSGSLRPQNRRLPRRQHLVRPQYSNLSGQKRGYPQRDDASSSSSSSWSPTTPSTTTTRSSATNATYPLVFHESIPLPGMLGAHRDKGGDVTATNDNCHYIFNKVLTFTSPVPSASSRPSISSRARQEQHQEGMASTAQTSVINSEDEDGGVTEASAIVLFNLAILYHRLSLTVPDENGRLTAKAISLHVLLQRLLGGLPVVDLRGTCGLIKLASLNNLAMLRLSQGSNSLALQDLHQLSAGLHILLRLTPSTTTSGSGMSGENNRRMSSPLFAESELSGFILNCLAYVVVGGVPSDNPAPAA